ncbi:MAG: HupE/UreJ family protein [Bryobacteraceae bacterium]
MYQSAVMLDFTCRDVQTEVQLPLERVSTALGTRIDAEALERHRASLATYILDRLHVQASDGSAFQVHLQLPFRIETVDGAPYVVARAILQPPNAAAMDLFNIRDDILFDRIPSQVALVSIRSDWSGSIFANDPQLIGVLHGHSRSLTIDRSDRSWFRGFTSLFRLGIRHIAEGRDHLLFLLALLLPAPLLTVRHRWTGFAGMRHSVLGILKIVTAFTLGHSLTLALAALGVVSVPSRPVEVLIAISILISAMHALRPIFAGREPVIAAFFGLVHGLAFATTLSELGLHTWDRIASIFAFNLGIESMQLIVVAATMPSLILLSRTRCYPMFRIAGGSFATFASVAWIAERLFDRHTSVDFVIDSLAHHAGWISLLLFLTGLILWLTSEAPHRALQQPNISPE